MELGSTIKRLRKQKGMTQKLLAEQSKTSKAYLSQIESGARPATVKKLEQISEVLDVPFSVLSFLALDENTLSPEKRDKFRKVEPTINELINEVFFTI